MMWCVVWRGRVQSAFQNKRDARKELNRYAKKYRRSLTVEKLRVDFMWPEP